MNVAALLEGRRICVCTGPGGVGKTTVSAAIGLGMAARGARVAVVTIDPARRLADALGLEQLGNEPRPVAAERLPNAPLSGELWAMMLDPGRTFDELIDSVAPSPERAAQIKGNRVYGELSCALAGAPELTAVAKLYELADRDEFDLLVLDTPPARNALDFLDAPARLSAFLEGRALQAFLRPTAVGLQLLAPLLAALGRITGVNLVGDLTTFFGLLGDMTGEFSRRAHAVELLLRSEQTAFVVISTAQRPQIDEALALRRALRDGELPFAGAIVNRFHPPAAAEPAELTQLLAPALGGQLAALAAAACVDQATLAGRDAAQVARLERELGGAPLRLVPQLDDDVHDIEGLLRVRAALFGS